MEQSLFITMNGGMATIAQSNPVRDFITKIGIVSPLLFVMGVQMVFVAAMLASMFISFENSLTPFLIFPSIAFFWCWASGRIPFTTLRTILRSWVSIAGIKGLFAMLANVRLLCVVNLIAGIRAVCAVKPSVIYKFPVTNATLYHPAVIAVLSIRLIGSKRITAIHTGEIVRLLFREINTLFAKIAALGGYSPAVGAYPRTNRATLLNVTSSNIWAFTAFANLLCRHGVNNSTDNLKTQMSQAFPHLEIKRL